MSTSLQAGARIEAIRVDRGSPLATLAGRILFGLLTILMYVIVEGWDALGEPWGPGASSWLAFTFFGLHMVLVRGQIAGLDPVVWIPVSMLLFYFGLPIANGIPTGLPPVGYDIWHVDVSPSLNRGFAAHLVALLAFLFGIHLAGVHNLSRAHMSKPDLSLRVPTTILLVISVVMIVLGIIIVGPMTLFSTYDVWWDAKYYDRADARWIDTGLMFAIAAIAGLLATDDGTSRMRRLVAYTMTAAIAPLFLLKGDRTHLIGLFISVGWVYTQRVRRIPPALVFSLAVMALLALPVIKEFREWRSVEVTTTVGPFRLLSAILSEMGSSALAFVYTLDLVPAASGYRWGMSYLSAFVELLPNFGLTPGETLTLATVENTGSSYITSQIAPLWFEHGGGLGFSMAAEWYFNFGMPSVPIGMGFLGWITGRIRNASQNSALKLVLSAMFFMAMSLWVRNVIGYALRVALWPVIALVSIRLVVGLLGGPRAPNVELRPIPAPPNSGARV